MRLRIRRREYDNNLIHVGDNNAFAARATRRTSRKFSGARVDECN